MGRVRISLWLAAFFCFLSLAWSLPLAAEEALAPQADVYLPDLLLYLDQGGDPGDLTVKVPQTDMTCTVKSAEKIGDSQRGISYHVLLDISNSVSKDQLADMKKAVYQLAKGRRDCDRMELITFSDKVKVVLKGDESPDQVKKALDQLKPGGKTHLYEGINQLSDSVEAEQDRVIRDIITGQDIKRNVGIILTDWQEVKKAGGDTSRQEALRKIQMTGTPLYGFCLDSAKVALQDDMGEFLRETGGRFALFDQKKKTQLTDLHKRFLDQTAYSILSSSRKTLDQEKHLEITKGDSTVKADHVFFNRARPDGEKPVIKDVKEEDARTLTLTFSEDVLRADNKNNYSIMKGGKSPYTVSEATYTHDSENPRVRLILNDELARGDYEISLVNVTDNTNEENELTDAWTGHLEGEGFLKGFYRKLGRFWGLLLLLAVLGILLGIYLYIRRHRGLMVVEDQIVLGDGMGKKTHVKSNDDSVKDIVLLISGIAAQTNRIETRINGSIMVGRASICDIYFDDITMSRQHFAMEVDKGSLYVTNLSETTGTFVDGEQIRGRKQLSNGSVIQAGSVSMEVRW